MRFFVSKCSFIFIYLIAVISQAVCRNCPPLESDSVDIVCEYGNDIVSCETPTVTGTRARLACKPSYRIPLGYDPGYRELTCLSEGVWDRLLFNCIPECGTVLAEGKPFIIDGFPAKRGFPWHVGIYRKASTGSFIQICGGTLVSPDLVVSAAHCFYDDYSRTLSNANNYAVAAGKHFRSYYTAEPFVQKSMIKNISITKRYFGLGGNYAQDISLLRLESPFTITTLVRPVCVDWENEFERAQLQEGNSGKIVGWGKNAAGDFSEELLEINLPYVNYGKCFSEVPEDFRNFITNDKFCAGYLNGSSLCDGDSGGGLCFQFKGRWYLRGIVSVGPVNSLGSCDRNYYTAFTNAGKFLDWIREAYFNLGNHDGKQYQLFASGITLSCILPEQPRGGSFELGSCKGDCKVVPGSRAPLGSFLTYKCNEGYTLSGNNISFCYEAGWYSPPTCLKKVLPKYCPELISKSVEFNCTYQGEPVSCTSKIVPGTKAILGCKNFYHMPSADPRYSEITCLENYLWDHNVFECDPECGTALPKEAKLFVDGFEFVRDRFPWRVLVYKKNSTSNFSRPHHGILIKPDLVMTQAANLVKEDIGKVLNPKNYAVIAGQKNLEYDSPEPYTQHSFVERLETLPGYMGELGNYSKNIVLLRLKTPFDVTVLARPICLDWDNRVTRKVFENSKKDQVTGSRNTTGNRLTNASFYSSEECLLRIEDIGKNYISNETFCADCKTESVHSNGDLIGGGFGYESKGVWYLLGYYKRSVAPKDNSCHWIHSFGKLAPHLNWIREFYNRRPNL